MSAHDTVLLVDTRLPLLEDFRSEAWGRNDVFQKETTRQLSGSNTRNIQYLDFGKHLDAVQHFCSTIENEKLLVFQEYRDAMSTFESQCEGYKKGACIIGQPGIGKSCFIAYAVVERLRQMQPVAVEIPFNRSHSQYLLFTAHGVTLHDEMHVDPLRSQRTTIWAFSDSNEYYEIPPFAFTGTSGVRTFQTTSPAVKRWKEWTKQRRVAKYIMDVPSDEEIEDFAFILEKDLERMKILAAKWGPVPRTLLTLLDLPNHERHLEAVVADAVKAAAENPQAVIQALVDLNSATIQGSSTIFFAKATSKAIDGRGAHILFVPTPWLLSQVMDGLYHRQDAMRAEFFNIMTGRSGTRSAAGAIFEEIAHRFLVHEQRLSIQWKDDKVQPTEPFQKQFLKTYFIQADLARPPPFYWRPATSSFPGIDGVLIVEGYVFVIQVTIRLKHGSPQKGVDQVWEDICNTTQKSVDNLWDVTPHKRNMQWRMVFVSCDKNQTKAVIKSKHLDKLSVGGRTKLPVGRLVVPGIGFDPQDLHSPDEQEATDTF